MFLIPLSKRLTYFMDAFALFEQVTNKPTRCVMPVTRKYGVRVKELDSLSLNGCRYPGVDIGILVAGLMVRRRE
jgi:hypothetical protein